VRKHPLLYQEVRSGHIVGKEGGAIEAIGQKIIVAPGVNGKLTPEIIRSATTLSAQFPYQPKARMVYVSNATEMGTVYTKRELESIASLCKELGMFLLLDGARLGAALTSSKNDMSMADIYNFTDIFWIGGTKNGALLGEAVVIKDPSFGSSFGYHMKQRGALLAKGRVLGIQFATLFQDDLFFELARHANDAAEIIGASLTAQGFKLWAAVDSNQVFVIFPAAIVQELAKSFDFVVWEHLQDEMQVVRLVTSWATLSSEVSRFCEAVADCSK
jgi:threonine aldolase